MLCIRLQNEILNTSPETPKITSRENRSCKHPHQGGVILFRLMVSVLFGVETRDGNRQIF